MPHHTRSKTRPPSSSSSSAINIEATERSESKDETPLSNQAERRDGLDKENVKKSAFQPPSPLTSRRSKQKQSTSKKFLSPNRNNQWTRDREATTSSSRQPRSSPIHGRQSYSQVSTIVDATFLGAPFSSFFSCGTRTCVTITILSNVLTLFWSQNELIQDPSAN